jgi:hypothetical protein
MPDGSRAAIAGNASCVRAKASTASARSISVASPTDPTAAIVVFFNERPAARIVADRYSELAREFFPCMDALF